MTQYERILDYIRTYGSITPMEAFRDLGCTKLATRISEMKRNGIEFKQEYTKGTNRFGETVYYMTYRFKNDKVNNQ